MAANIVMKSCAITFVLFRLNGAHGQSDPVSAQTQNAVHDCTSPPETGSCKAMFLSWNYDAASGVCVQFFYGGCEGNGNRYESNEDCQQACSARNGPAVHAGQSEATVKDCTSPPKTGQCKGLLYQYNYNPATGQCSLFVYGGCEGNGNRYNSIEDCQQACSATGAQSHAWPASTNAGQYVANSEAMVKDCTSPPKTGRCKGLLYRYNYNPNTGLCSPFVYGGCDGNGNRYSTLEFCQQACGTVTTGP